MRAPSAGVQLRWTSRQASNMRQTCSGDPVVVVGKMVVVPRRRCARFAVWMASAVPSM